MVGSSVLPTLFFLKIEHIQESSAPALAELRFDSAQGHNGGISPGPSLEAAGMEETPELALCSWGETGSVSGSPPEATGARPRVFPERARPLAAGARNGARESRGIPGSPHPAPPSARGARGREVVLANTNPGVAAPTSLSARVPGFPRAHSGGGGQGGVLAWEARWPRWLARLRMSCLSRGARGTVAGGSPPSPLAGSAPRARAPPARAGEARVIACSGTMPTFEPLTTKQTTLVLSLHCPNKVY